MLLVEVIADYGTSVTCSRLASYAIHLAT